MIEALMIVGAYIVGSVPIGVIVGRVRGFDPRAVGSGNIGTANVARAGGASAAAITFAGDVLKGAIPVMAAQAAVEDADYVRNYVAEVLAARELLCVGLEKLDIAYVPSSANFVLGHFGKRAIEVRDALRGQGILVRDRSYEAPGCVRITVGTRAQTRKLLAALEEIWRQ